MVTIECFLNVILYNVSNDSYKKISDELNELFNIQEVQVIGKGINNEVQISIVYDPQIVSLDEVLQHLTVNNGTVTGLNIHFTSELSGVNDPYGASGISLAVEEALSNVNGVLGSSISEMGSIRILLDHTLKNKQFVIEEIIQVIKAIRSV